MLTPFVIFGQTPKTLRLMDWISLIDKLLPFILGGGLVAIFTVPAAIKKAKIENESFAIEPLRQTNEQLRGEITRMEERYASLETKYEEMVAKMEAKQAATTEKYENKCEECATAKNMMCVHLGCSLRDPMLGQGDAWYEAHKENISLGVDYTGVNVLMKRLGEKRRRMAETKEDDN